MIFISFTSTSLFWTQQQSQMGSLKLYGKHFCIFELLQWPSVYSVTQWQLNFATYSDVRNPLMFGFNVKHPQHVIYNRNVYDLYHDIKRQNQTVLLLWWEALIRKIRFLHKNFQLFKLTYQQIWFSVHSLFLQQAMPEDQQYELALNKILFSINFQILNSALGVRLCI